LVCASFLDTLTLSIIPGFGGYNSRWCVLIVERVVQQAATAPPLFVTVGLGANDAARLEVNPRQHVPLHEYVDNLRLIVRTVQSIGEAASGVPTPVVLMAPPPGTTSLDHDM
jgi:lysophospholipase L1-like esterase